MWSQHVPVKTQINFKNIGREQGLPRDKVYAITQDSAGYIWISSLNGINRYNGKDFKVYDVGVASLTDQSVNDQKIYTDRMGRVWALVGDGTLAVLDRKLDRFIPVPAIDKAKCMLQSKDGTYYFGTVGMGLWRIQPPSRDTLQILDVKDLPEEVNRLAEHQDGIFAATTKGVFQWKNSETTWMEVPVQGDDNYSAITASEHFGLWLGTLKNGLYRLDEVTSAFEPFNGFKDEPLPGNLDIADLRFDSQQRLWVSTLENGVFLIDFQNEGIQHLTNDKYNRNSLLSNKTLGVYEDTQKGIWVATGNGISLYDPYLFKFNRLTQNELPYQLTMSEVSQIDKDAHGNIWFATSETGIFKMDSGSGAVSHFGKEDSALSSNAVYAIQFIGDQLWISTADSEIQVLSSGGDGLNTEKAAWREKAPVIAIRPDSDGNVWLHPYGQGLIQYSKDLKVLYDLAHDPNNPNTLPSNMVFDFKEGPGKHLWIITAAGLCSYHLKTGTLQRYGLDLNRYSKIAPFLDGTLWIWNHNSGLLHYDPSEDRVVKRFDITPQFTVQSINYHQDWFWMGTSQGIVKINRMTGEMVRYSNQLGLQGAEYSFAGFWDPESSTMYLGGKKGINWFNPGAIPTNPYAPETVIAEVRLFEERLDTSMEYAFEHDQNALTFEVSGLQYASSGGSSFKYRLLPSESDWLENQKSGIIRYSNLPPGSYEFQAMSSNYDGVWDQTPATFRFEVQKPWYLGRTAWTLYATGMGLLLLAIYWYFKSRWEMQAQLRFKQQESERLKELDTLKNRIYTNISHEFRTPLTLISGPVERQLKNPEHPEHLMKDLQLVGRSSRRLLKLVDQLLDLAKLETGNMKLLVKEVRITPFLRQIIALYEYEAERKNITLTGNLGPLKTGWLDLDVVEKVLTNLLSNAVKYTPEGGTIRYNAQVRDSRLIFSVSNSPVSIPPDKLPVLFERYYQSDRASAGAGIGLSLVKELVLRAYGKVDAQLLAEDAIEFTVMLPVSRDAYPSGEVAADGSAEPPEYQPEPAGANTLKTPNSGKLVLQIVEDDAQIRSFIKSVFQDEYQVITSSNGKKGLEQALKSIPDIILSDVMMPEMDGLEMTRLLKENELTSHIPVILLTAKSGEASQLTGLRSGADDYITKPFHSEALQLKVANMMRLQRELKMKYMRGGYPEVASRNNLDTQFLQRLQTILEENLADSGLTSEELAKKMTISRTQLHRKLKALVGKTTTEFIRNHRTQVARRLLEESDLSIKEIAYQVGFNTPAYFVTSFKKDHNTTPASYRAKL